MEDAKKVHTIVLDAGPLIKNDPSVSSLLKHSNKIVTIPQVISEIRDENTRSRLNTTLKPFLDVREPKEASIKVISDFARRTGDLSVLSRPDILLLALTYDIECKRSGGDWRLRSTPGQKGRNGQPPESTLIADVSKATGSSAEPPITTDAQTPIVYNRTLEAQHEGQTNASGSEKVPEAVERDVTKQLASTKLAETPPIELPTSAAHHPSEADEVSISEDSDSEGWITPSNLKLHQAKENSDGTAATAHQPMEAALLTSDFAMQNVALQMNLNLLSPSLARIKTLKTFILRCHACFQNVKDMSKQFCPRCGQPSLTRVACSTNTAGEFKLHLKKNFQFNTRGDRYSIPKPVGGSASGKLNVGGGGKGGGKGGWGSGLILAEDQKEFERAMGRGRRYKEKDLLDEDYLPGILSGERHRGSGRPKIGAGRNVNSKKRH